MSTLADVEAAIKSLEGLDSKITDVEMRVEIREIAEKLRHYVLDQKQQQAPHTSVAGFKRG